jgi:uncharacterized protein (DUF488 family)
MVLSSDAVTIWTIGHSTLAIQEFLTLLDAHGIGVVADVRRFPMSRRHPQYNQDALTAALAGEGVRYESFQELGGRRTPRPASPNTAWRNASFRGYADYMETAAFQTAVGRLMTLAAADRTAIMCAEALWWRCHRALIADCLRASGSVVLHVTPAGTAIEHPFTAAAHVIDGKLSYVGDLTLGL